MTQNPSSTQGIAEELAESQQSISIAEFFEKNKHMLGFDSPSRAIVTAVKEAVDNSLDATEEADILPEIHVKIEKVGDNYKLVVEDNGPGIPRENVPKVFGKLLYGSRFHLRAQSRGQQGIGISAAVLYSQLTSGKPAKILSKTNTQDDAKIFYLSIDTDTNEPEIQNTEKTTWDKNHGTRIELEMDATMRGRKRLHKYIRHTAVVNPHASISLTEPEASLSFDRVTEELPEDTKEIKPHPHGIEQGTLRKMLEETDSYQLRGFLKTEFTRVGDKSADKILSNFRDTHFGRELQWPISGMNDIKGAVTSSVRRKGKSVIESFAEDVEEELTGEVLSHGELDEVVDELCDRGEKEYEKTFGLTVRTNLREALWKEVSGEDEKYIRQIVDDSTSKRKDEDTITVLSEEITNKLCEIDGMYRFTRDALTSVVRQASNETESRLEDSRIGETSQENIVGGLWEHTASVNDNLPKVKAVAGNRVMEANLLEAMEMTSLMAPPSDCLSPIKSDLIEAGMKKVYDGAEFYAASTRGASVQNGEPFIAEAGIAFGGDIDTDGKANLLRFANRVPLVYQEGACVITRSVKGIRWRNYKVSQSGDSGLPDEDMVILVDVASTNVPFTSESKDAIANEETIENEVELAVREAARKLKSHITEKQNLQQRKRKRNSLRSIYPELAEKATKIADVDDVDWREALANVMNDILVKRDSADDGKVSLTVENFVGSSREITVVEEYGSKPDGRRTPKDSEKYQNEGGTWSLEIMFELDNGESETVKYPEDSLLGKPDVRGIKNELVTIEVNNDE